MVKDKSFIDDELTYEFLQADKTIKITNVTDLVVRQNEFTKSRELVASYADAGEEVAGQIQITQRGQVFNALNSANISFRKPERTSPTASSSH